MGASRPSENVDPALYEAAEIALLAPSILNTQPWRWRVGHRALRLYADRERAVRSIDPQGRLLTLSCGGALHHADTALRAHGHEPTIVRLPSGGEPDLLAELRIGGPHRATELERLQARAIRHRHTDRRAIAATARVEERVLAALRTTADAAGAHLHQVGPDQRPFLAIAASRAQDAEATQQDYRDDLVAWTDRRRRGEGVPVETLVATTVRTVAVRDFAGGGETGLHPGFGDDSFAEFLILATDGDVALDWLRAGEAMSAVWLTATGHNVAASVLSDVVEVAQARAMVAALLPADQRPQLVLRVGIAAQPTPPPPTPRRQASTVISVDDLPSRGPG